MHAIAFVVGNQRRTAETFLNYFLAAVIFTFAGSCLAGHELVTGTGIILKANVGAVKFRRMLEPGSFDIKSQLVTVQRGYKFASQTPTASQGCPGTRDTSAWVSMVFDRSTR
jgi:hypothetical protein